ncbi:MAG: ASKHA domain-containing protein [Anaerolineae bacterium]
MVDRAGEGRGVQVTFRPEDERVSVPAGTTLLAAAKAAGADLASLCGGEGLCGKCRVIVRDGNIAAAPTSLLTREEIQTGYVLACQTKVLGDVEVEIPPESRAEGIQILIDVDAQRFRALHPAAEEAVAFRHAPLTQKLPLELSPPSLEDNLADQARLFREIRRHRPASIMQLGLKVIKTLPKLLRDFDWRATATLGWRGGTLEVLQVEPGDTAGRNYGIAVDVGTSTIVAHLLDLNTAKQLDAEAVYNSQRIWGEEVTRRIIYAERGGLDELQKAVASDINNMISVLVERNHIALHNITAVTCAGNTTMTHLLLGLKPGSIRKSPYVATSTTPPPIRAVEVGIQINPRGLLYGAPCIGGWVGGDITAGILAVGLHRAKRVRMLVDIGTNGEIVIGNQDWMITCSASAGPAFEGSGVKCGMKATRGAIERVLISPEGNVNYRTVGNARPRGICGSGFIDLVAGLYETGFIDRSGNLLPGTTQRIRERDGTFEFVLVPEARSDTGKDLVVTQADLNNLLSAKAAIYAGANVLAKTTGLDFDEIEMLYIAGGFGNYLDREKAIAIGLIPDLPLEKIRFVGNTSILGVRLALLSEEAWTELERVAQSVTYYDLISYPHYYDEFLAAKFIPHTDLSRFPSVVEKLKLEERV